MAIFHPWSDTVVSTSEWEGIHAYRTGEWANEGVMIIVPLLFPHPFGVAKLTNANRDGTIEYQWWGNESEDIRKSLQPGWIAGQDSNSNPLIYYHHQPKVPGHAPYTGHVDLPMTQKDIVVHLFELSKTQKLAMVVLKAIDEDYRIWWTMGTVEKPEKRKTRVPNGIRHETTAVQETDAPNGTRHETTTSKRPRSPRTRRETNQAKRVRSSDKVRLETNAVMSISTASMKIGYVGTNMTTAGSRVV
jgi:hypothetical protein